MITIQNEIFIKPIPYAVPLQYNEISARLKFESTYPSLWEYVQGSESQSFKMTSQKMQNIAGIPAVRSFLKYKKELAAHGHQVGRISMKEQNVIFHKTD